MVDTAVQATASTVDDTWRKYLPRIILVSLLTNLGFGFVGPFLPLYIQEITGYDAQKAALWAGIIAAANGPVSFVAGPRWGVLSDWFGHKKNVLRGAFGTTLVMVATGLSQNLGQIIATRVVMGAAAGVNPAIMGLTGTLAPKK